MADLHTYLDSGVLVPALEPGTLPCPIPGDGQTVRCFGLCTAIRHLTDLQRLQLEECGCLRPRRYPEETADLRGIIEAGRTLRNSVVLAETLLRDPRAMSRLAIGGQPPPIPVGPELNPRQGPSSVSPTAPYQHSVEPTPSTLHPHAFAGSHFMQDHAAPLQRCYGIGRLEEDSIPRSWAPSPPPAAAPSGRARSPSLDSFDSEEEGPATADADRAFLERHFDARPGSGHEP